GHTERTYTNLWTDFQKTDKKDDGSVWDMYSDNPAGAEPYTFTFVTDQCGTYATEGDCYNREHSFPKSWFNEGSPMYSDLFHLYPTDGYVNGQRSAYPFGEVSSPTWTSQNGSMRGTSSYAGYTGTVFEPIDEYKGDFARTYFYMATRYENVISGWENFSTDGDAVLDGTTYPCYETWFVNMLLEWHTNDTVSQKEINRNDSVYTIQGNRNPYIDHPEYAGYVWGGESPINGGGGEEHWTESFEEQTTNTYITEFTCSNSGTWTALNAGNFGLGTPRTGTKCVAINDDSPGAHLTTPSINTLGTVSFYYYQRSGAASDEFQLQVSVDGGDFTNLGDPSPYNVGETYTLFTYDVNETSSDIKLRVLNDNQAAHLIIDDFTVTAYSSSGSVNNPSNFLSSSAGLNQIDLSWDLNASSNNVILAYSLSNTFGIPTDGQAYTVDDEITGGGTIIYTGSSISFNHTELTEDTQYFYKLWSFDESTNYSSGITSNATTQSSSSSYTESFDNFTESGSTYVDGTFTGVDGSTWTYKQCRGDQLINGATPCLGKDRTPVAEVSSGTIFGGCGTLNFDYKQAFSTNVSLDLFINESLISTFTTSSQLGVVLNSGDQTINVLGDFVIKFIQNNTGSGQVSIDNVSWTPYVPIDCTPPATQASNISFSNIGQDSLTVSWTRGNGDEVIVLAKEGSAIDTDPVSGTSYTDSLKFVNGQEIGTGNYVVYIGNGTSINVTGLSSATNYHFAIYEFFTTDSCYNIEETTGDVTTTSWPITSGYYTDADGKTCEQLKTSLYNIIKGHTEFPYTSDNTDVWDILMDTDEDPNNPDNVILIYSLRSQDKDFYNRGEVYDYSEWGVYENCWEREHVWAKSHGDFGTTMGAGTDVHHLRPVDRTMNSEKYSKDLDNGGTEIQENGEPSGNYTDSDSYEPHDNVKGDVARMIFYMATRYEGENGEPDLEINDLVENYPNPYFGRLSVLLDWHENDPVSDWERLRNDKIYESYQGNRNPFIDHPEYVAMIWNDTCPANPVISNITTFPELPDLYSAVNISADITDEGNITSAILFWCTDGVSFNQNINMSINSGNNYITDTGIPVQNIGTTVSYFIRAIDDDTDTTFSDTLSYFIGSEVVIISDNFTICPSASWSIENIDGDNKEWTCSSNAMNANGYGATPAGSNADDWLVSPLINLNSYDNEILTFETSVEYTGPDLSLKYSTDYLGTGDPNTATWNSLSFTLASSSSLTSSGDVYLSAIDGSVVYLAFHYTSTGTTSGNAASWTVDNILLKGDSLGICVPPSLQASDFSTLDVSSTLAGISWTRGDGDSVIVFAKKSSVVNFNPENGNSYTSDTSFGNGDELGTGNYVVYNGAGSSVSIGNLEPNTTYHFAIYEYNTNQYCYKSDSLTGSLTTEEDPKIIAHPEDLILCTCDTAVFFVNVVGTESLSYQWKKNGVDIGDANETTFSINSVTQSDTGSYSCSISNSLGSITSTPAYLTVNYTEQPSGIDQAVCFDGVVTILSATGSNLVWYSDGELAYQLSEGSNFITGQSAVGIYEYYVTQTGNNCESLADTVTLEIYDLPVAIAGDNISIPYGTTTSLNGSATGGFGIYDYLWSPADSVIDFQLANTTTVNLQASTIFNLNVTDEHTCSSNDQVLVTVTGGILSVSIDADDMEICNGDSVLLAAIPSGGSGTYTYTWSSNPEGFSSTNATEYFSPTVNTSFKVVVDDGNFLDSAEVNIIVHDIPLAPIASDINICDGDFVPDLTATGTSINWYSDGGLNDLLYQGNTFSTGLTEIGLYGFYLTQSVDNCTSQADTVVLSINAIPDKLSVSDINVCFGIEIPEFNADGANISWYSDGELTSIITTGNSFVSAETEVGEYIYYVTQTLNGCQSYSDTISLNILYKPIIESGWSEFMCMGDTMQIDIANDEGFIYSWTSNPIGFTSEIKDPFVQPVENTYYILIVNNSGCTSIDSIFIEVYDNPDIELGEDIIVCEGVDPIVLSEEEGYDWYYWNGIQTTESTYIVEESGQYILQVFTFTGCTDIDTINVEIINLPPQLTVGDITTCYGDTIPEIYPDGINIKWYADGELSNLITEGNGFIPTISDVGEYFYYVTQTISGCESLADTVKLIINEIPETPVSENVSVCFGETVPTLFATGVNVEWYSDSNLTDLVNIENYFITGEVEVGIYTYYVIQYVNECQSEAIIVELSVLDKPEPPVGAGAMGCENGFILDLYAEGTNINWYVDEELTMLLDTGNVYISNETEAGIYAYYATQTINGCESDAAIVELTIYPQPDLPVGNDVSTCFGYEIPELFAEGENISWYADSELTELIASGNTYVPTETNVGEYNYFIVQFFDECFSLADTVTLVIKETPQPPVGNDVEVCSGNVIPDLTAEGENISWYADTELNELIGSGNEFISPETNVGVYNYFIVQFFDECFSLADTVTLIINSIPQPPIGNDSDVCFGDINPVLTVEGENINWYADGELATLVDTGNSYQSGETEIGFYHYFVTQSNSECESLADTVIFTILENPSLPFAESAEACFGEEAIYLIATGSNIAWYEESTLDNLIMEDDSLLVNVTEVGNYSYYATQTVNNCQSDALEVSLIINPLPVANFNYTIEFLEVTFENLSEHADSNLWNFGDDSYSSEENPVHLYYPGYYETILYAYNYCGTDEMNRIILVGVSVEDIAKSKISIFPNPITDQIILENLIAVERILFTDVYGRKINEIERPDFRIEIDTQTLTEGTYFIHIILKNSTNKVFKVIK
ncbi:endonuclease, partial [Bacteroidota bacterium]